MTDHVIIGAVKEASLGSHMGAYVPDFPPGTTVQIADVATLRRFARPVWIHHHPIGEDQITWAGKTATVSTVSFYHGGDELYALDGVPGLWHKGCLQVDEE